MDFRPPRTLGFVIGGVWLSLALGGLAWGAWRLGSAPISPASFLWGAAATLSLVLAAVAAYRLYGLWTARYRLDRNGFSVQWGWSSEQLPWSAVSGVADVPPEQGWPRWPRGVWWPGCLVGQARNARGEPLEFFAARPVEGCLAVSAVGRHLLISPADRRKFLEAYRQATRQGILESIPEISSRPEFLALRLWGDPAARSLILAGLFSSLALVVFLAVRSPTLPDRIPFGFDPLGSPSPAAPQGRLLLLPMAALAFWFVNFVGGSWLYRHSTDRLVSYALWAGVILVSGLLWTAVLQMLAVAQ